MDVPGEPRPRVLVADDDEGIRDALRDMLEAEGIEVVATVSDGEGAVTAAATFTPDVILMDLRMPEMSGTDATAKIRSRPGNAQVIILSAYDDPGLYESAERAGAYAYLVKGCAASLVRDVLLEAYKLKVGLDQRDTEELGAPS